MKGTIVRGFRGDTAVILSISLLILFVLGSYSTDAVEIKTDGLAPRGSLPDTISIFISSKAAPPGAVFTIQIYVEEDLDPYNILSMQFQMVVNPTLLSFRTAVPGDVIPEGNMFEFGFKSDTLIVATGSADKFIGRGTLAVVEFRVLSSAQDGQTTVLSFEHFQFNEAHVGPEVKTYDAPFVVGRVPDIELSGSEYQFGETHVGNTANWNLIVSNIGWANLRIESIVSSNEEFGVSGISFPVIVEPGADADLTVFFSPSHMGERSGLLTINSNDYFEHQVYVRLGGIGVAPDIALSQREYAFGQVTVGYGSNWEFQVYNVGNAELIIDSVLVYPPVFRAPSPVFPFTIEEQETLLVSAQFFPTAVGQVAGVLTLFTNDPDERTVDVFLSGVGIPPEADIAVTVASHDFGGIYLGTSATWSLFVLNEGTAPLQIHSITSDREEFEIDSPIFPRDVNPGGSINVIVRFTPQSEASVEGTLTVDSDDPDEAVLLIPVAGHGVAPAVMTVQGGLGNPGAVAAQVPIALENQVDIRSLVLVLSFPEGILTPMAAIPTGRSEAMETFQVNLGYDVGKTRLTISGETQSIPAGSGPFAKIAFGVTSDAPNGDYPLTLSEVSATDIHGSEVSFQLQDSIFAIRPVGIEDNTEYSGLPRTFALIQNHPNPFNPVTDIRYQISALSRGRNGIGDERSPVHTTLKIYNVLGQEIRTLVDEVQPPGYYTVRWNGTDSANRDVPSGIYLYRLETRFFTAVKKMILAR